MLVTQSWKEYQGEKPLMKRTCFRDCWVPKIIYGIVTSGYPRRPKDDVTSLVNGAMSVQDSKITPWTDHLISKSLVSESISG